MTTGELIHPGQVDVETTQSRAENKVETDELQQGIERATELHKRVQSEGQRARNAILELLAHAPKQESE